MTDRTTADRRHIINMFNTRQKKKQMETKEKAIDSNGTIIKIPVENMELNNNAWAVTYNNRKFEYHGNIWMEC